MRGSAGATAHYQQLSIRWIGILHGCLKTGTTYDEHTAWAHILERAA
jgi:hypothetical protein